MIIILLFIAACFLAFTNGANDNFKGVATLFGSNTTSYRKAINWGTVTTFAGSVAAIFLAGELVANFSGKGLVPDELIQLPVFAISIALGAALTVFLATKIAMPISTTHALVGGLFGVGIVTMGTEFNFGKLLNVFVIPLLLSPFMAAILSFLAYRFFRLLRVRSGVTKDSCVCVNELEKAPVLANMNSNNFTSTKLEISACVKTDAANIYQGEILGITVQKILDTLHFASAGIVSFARGLNDTPKIMGLLVVVNALDIKWGILAIGVAMATGGLLKAKKVGFTMSKKITPMNHGQGFTANIITGLLVTTASIHGFPVSTTHVSVGSIFGIGTVTKKANPKMISKILLSWLLTLPVAALFGAVIYLLLSKFV